MTYHLTVAEGPGYLYAMATGEHSAENARRFLEEAYRECIGRGYASLLLHMAFEGEGLDAASIFGVISAGSARAATLAKVAYVDTSRRATERMVFAETVAHNRGVNVRLFRDLEEAKRWLAAYEKRGP